MDIDPEKIDSLNFLYLVARLIFLLYQLEFKAYKIIKQVQAIKVNLVNYQNIIQKQKLFKVQ